MDTRPTILVTNDDGITAPGIRALVEVAKELGRVVVVAPDSPQSGMGHAITIDKPLRLERVHIFDDVEAYKCTGTPADCVKLAKDKVLHKRPDLCLSGINHGSNSSINVIYSGTMSAAVEAAIEGINAIGVSLCDYKYDADFTASKKYALKVAKEVLEHGLPDGTLLNINVPRKPVEEIKGIRICRQANDKWVEDYDERKDPMGRTYYWLKGEFISQDKGDDTDEWALRNGFVSVVPVQFDLTAHHAITHIHQKWELNEG